MALEGVLLGGGGLHGEPVYSNWNTPGGSGVPLCPWFELLCTPDSRVFGCCGAEPSPAAAMFGVALVPAEDDRLLCLFTR